MDKGKLNMVGGGGSVARVRRLPLHNALNPIVQIALETCPELLVALAIDGPPSDRLRASTNLSFFSSGFFRLLTQLCIGARNLGAYKQHFVRRLKVFMYSCRGKPETREHCLLPCIPTLSCALSCLQICGARPSLPVLPPQ